jgi:FkbM family methyltransferase
MDYRYLFRDLVETKNLQQWINRRFKDPRAIIVDPVLFPQVRMKNGIVFGTSINLRTVSEAFHDYILSDIRQEDIVIDIGANIGGFALPAALLSGNVTAVEPVTTEELRDNIKINDLDVRVIEGGLGDGSDMILEWEKTKKTVRTFSFPDLRKMCGGCDFLKCDCEGYEWFIRPEELQGVRRIEMEVHNFNPSGNEPHDLIEYIQDNYQVEFIRKGESSKNITMKFRNDLITEVGNLHATHKN